MSEDRFIIGSAAPFEEDRQIEFKDVSGSNNPVDSIKNTVDEYAVAFLNSQGGRIFWGINNDRIVVGVTLDAKQRDELRRVARQSHI